MKHSLTINVTKKPVYGGVVSCRTVTVREKLLRLLLGIPQRLTILVPGDSIESLAIKELDDGGGG